MTMRGQWGSGDWAVPESVLDSKPSSERLERYTVEGSVNEAGGIPGNEQPTSEPPV